jgi:type II secretory pathway pseudopilin PulG
MTARLFQRLRGEHGMALVLAVLVLVIVSILTTAVIAYTTTNQQDAASKKSGVSAYALAQAALSNATAQLTSHYYDSTGQPFDNTTSLTTMASTWAPTAPNGGVGQQSPSSSAACTATSSCMSSSGILLCPVTVTCAGGGSPYTPSGVKQAAWRITATGRIPNPSGPGFLLRTITVDVPVEAPPAKAPVPDIFKSVYSGASTTGCDLSTGQGVHFSSPVYVVGNLCLGQHSSIEAGPENLGKLVVGGWIEIDQQANIGTNATPLPSVDVGKSCDNSQDATPCTLTQPAGHSYYANADGTIFATAYSNSPTFPTPPTVNWTQRQTDRGSWSCTNGHSLTAATFNLTGTSYTCTTESGTLSWDSTTSTLTIKGNIYVDGSMNVGGDFVYNGLGGIYAGGAISVANNTSICHGSTSHHDCPNGTDWPDIADNFLLLLGKTGISGANVSLEGGFYSDGTIDFGSGQTNIYGPIVTPGTIDPGQQAASGFPDIINLFTGAPGTPQPYWVLGAPQNGTY